MCLFAIISFHTISLARTENNDKLQSVRGAIFWSSFSVNNDLTKGLYLLPCYSLALIYTRTRFAQYAFIDFERQNAKKKKKKKDFNSMKHILVLKRKKASNTRIFTGS